MAVGDIAYQKSSYAAVKLLDAASADTAVPAAATDGVDITSLGTAVAYRAAPVGSVAIHGTGVTPSAKFRLWVYSPELGAWMPYGTGAAAAKGYINADTAVGGEETNILLHAETIQFIGHFTRVYLQITNSSGLTAVDAWLVVPRITQTVDK